MSVVTIVNMYVYYIEMKGEYEYLPLKVYSFNAQGLYSKFAPLSTFIADNNPDIVVITETWLTSDVNDTEFTPDGYCCFRKDRDILNYSPRTYQKSDRGGVLILVKSALNPVSYNEGQVDAEIIWVQINPRPGLLWLIGGCCRPKVDERHMYAEENTRFNQQNQHRK